MSRMTPPQLDVSRSLPVVLELDPAPRAVDVFCALSDQRHCLFLDSALQHQQLGRFSYVAADPIIYRQYQVDTHDPLGRLAADLTALGGGERIGDLPDFQGGAAGLFSYDLARTLERLPAPRCDDFQLPLLAYGIYDVVVAFDHRSQQAWIVSQGWPARSVEERQQRAVDRLKFFRQRIAAGGAARRESDVADDVRHARNMPSRPIALSKLAANYPLPRQRGLLSNFTAEGMQTAVAQAIEEIRAGEIFQVNLAQRLLYPARDDSRSLYLRLRRANPAPFAGYFDLGESQIVSASPERFLQVADRRVETRPIKGTRPRGRGAEADLFTGDDLCASEKDRSENVMIIDLMRNDLSRVCVDDSIRVSQYCRLETYPFVQHLVSAVTGRLAQGKGPIDLLRAAFPGGSITGAPKIRAMEIIAALEPHARGPYCGSLGYLTCDGAMDLSILIRTITASGGWWQFPVGAGSVVQSDPLQEYEEMWHKAEGLLRAIPLP
jgi:para-aminobenzoate synthetase component 1